MDKYVRVEAEHPPLPVVRNEVRIMTDGKIRNYIKYATALLLVRSNGGTRSARSDARLSSDDGCWFPPME